MYSSLVYDENEHVGREMSQDLQENVPTQWFAIQTLKSLVILFAADG
jgi:hypothetical protein